MSTSQLSPPPATSALYAATCNPPRKAKRPRRDSLSLDPSPPSPQSTSPNIHNVRIRPAPTQPATTSIAISPLPPMSAKRPGESPPSTSASLSNPEATSPDQTQLPPAKKRGRKPNNGSGGMSRSARESQRKINHSRIEKARRSKINDALDALRVLVPNDFGSEAQSSTLGPLSKKEEKDKEFKLDILERTVLFVRHLVEKVDTLEKQANVSFPSSSKSTTQAINTTDILKTQHEEMEEDLSDVDGDGDDEDHTSMRVDENMETEADIPTSQVASVSARTTKVAAAVQLPSISSWLGDIDVQQLGHQHQSAQRLDSAPINSPSTAMSPPLTGGSIHRREESMEHRASVRGVTGFEVKRGSEVQYDNGLGLLSPPGSGRINAVAQPVDMSASAIATGATSIAGSLPSLRLPSPRAGLASLLNEPQHDARHGSSRTTSRWTPEDENVASLLLQISSSASMPSASPPASSLLASRTRRDSIGERGLKARHEIGDSPVMKKVQTPGVMLGIEFSSKGHLSGR